MPPGLRLVGNGLSKGVEACSQLLQGYSREPWKLLDAAYPAHTAITLILDNHSVHISKETRAWSRSNLRTL